MPAAEDDLGRLSTQAWNDLQERMDALVKAWKRGESVDLQKFLPVRNDPNRRSNLIELIKTDMECRWRHGQAVVLGYYLEKFATELGSAEALPAALVYEEYRVRQLFGDRPPLATYQKRFPKQFAELERLIRDNPLPQADTPAGT